MNATLADFRLGESNIFLVIFDKGFISDEDEGKIGFYLFNQRTEPEFDISEQMAEALWYECTNEGGVFSDYLAKLKTHQVSY